MEKETDVKPDVLTDEEIAAAQAAEQSPVVEGAGEIEAQVAAEQEKGAVPYDRFKEVIDKTTSLEEQLAREKADNAQRITLMQQQILASQGQSKQQPVQDIYSEMGLADDEPVYLTVAQQRQLDARRQQEIQITLQTQAFLAQSPDFHELVGRINPNGQVETGEALKKVISTRPNLKGLEYIALQNPVAASVAYELAKQQKRIDELEAVSGASAEFLKQQEINMKTGAVSAQAAGGGARISSDDKTASLDPNGPEIARLKADMQAGRYDEQT